MILDDRDGGHRYNAGESLNGFPFLANDTYLHSRFLDGFVPPGNQPTPPPPPVKREKEEFRNCSARRLPQISKYIRIHILYG